MSEKWTGPVGRITTFRCSLKKHLICFNELIFLIFMKKTTKTKLQIRKYNCQHQIIEKPDNNYFPYSICFKTEI